jgi:hypothetical protein
MDAYPIRYEFRFDDGTTADFTARLNPRTLELLDPPDSPVPAWAALGCGRCSICPLPDSTPHCPTAAHLAGVVTRFAHTFSYVAAQVRVVVPEREFAHREAVQDALSSLLGVYMVSSGCPVLAALRPMVRFHLPFATELDTTWRATSMYLVAQFLRARSGMKAGLQLDGLVEVYHQVEEVNAAFAERLRRAATKDANINALVHLDLFAKAMPANIADGLEQLRELFSPWLQG